METDVEHRIRNKGAERWPISRCPAQRRARRLYFKTVSCLCPQKRKRGRCFHVNSPVVALPPSWLVLWLWGLRAWLSWGLAPDGLGGPDNSVYLGQSAVKWVANPLSPTPNSPSFNSGLLSTSVVAVVHFTKAFLSTYLDCGIKKSQKIENTSRLGMEHQHVVGSQKRTCVPSVHNVQEAFLLTLWYFWP